MSKTQTIEINNVESAINNFAKIVDSYSSHEAPKETTLINKVNTLTQSVVPAPRSKNDLDLYIEATEKKGIAVYNAVNEILASKLTAQYPVLSDDIFNLKRHLTLAKVKAGTTNKSSFVDYKIIADSVNKDVAEKAKIEYIQNQSTKTVTKVNLKTGKTVESKQAQNKFVHKSTVIEGPLFLISDVGSEVSSFYSKKHTTGYSYYKKTTTTNITAKTPNIPENILRKEKMECMSAFYEACASVYKDKKLQGALENYIPEAPKFEIMWIPTADSLNVDSKVEYKKIVRDPVLLMNVFGRRFVVAKWDIKDEEDYKHIIREFTEGDIGNKLD